MLAPQMASTSSTDGSGGLLARSARSLVDVGLTTTSSLTGNEWLGWVLDPVKARIEAAAQASVSSAAAAVFLSCQPALDFWT